MWLDLDSEILTVVLLIEPENWTYPKYPENIATVFNSNCEKIYFMLFEVDNVYYKIVCKV